jgi:hypothetical protein
MCTNRTATWVVLAALTGLIVPASRLPAQSPQGRESPPPVRLATFEQPAAVRVGDVVQLAPAPAPAPKVGIVLKDRHGHATPTRTYVARCGGGTIDVAQPSDDKIVITLAGVVTAPPHPIDGSAASIVFDFDQAFAITFADSKVKQARLIVEAQVIGLLRGDKFGGCAGVDHGSVAVFADKTSLLSLSLEGHHVSGDEHLAINDHKGPVAAGATPGDYHLLQTFRIDATHGRSIRGKAAAAEFAPEPALDPTWISVNDPFRGANKKEFGFRVTLRVEPD